MPEAPKPSLYAKLAQVMAEVGYVQKRGWNDHHRYHYVTEADLVEAVREKLASRNVMLIPSAPSVERVGTLTTVGMTFTFCDGDSGETHVAQWAGTGDDKGDKGLYKAYTGSEKYFLMKAFMIATGDDPEADTKTDERAALPTPPVVETIKEVEAKGLYDEAQKAEIPDDKLLQAIAHVSQARASKLEELTGPQALKLGAWIEKKGAEAKTDA